MPADSERRSARGKLRRRRRLAAEYLAYEVWRYERPNSGAVDEASAFISTAVEALASVDLAVVLAEARWADGRDGRS